MKIAEKYSYVIPKTEVRNKIKELEEKRDYQIKQLQHRVRQEEWNQAMSSLLEISKTEAEINFYTGLTK